MINLKETVRIRGLLSGEASKLIRQATLRTKLKAVAFLSVGYRILKDAEVTLLPSATKATRAVVRLSLDRESGVALKPGEVVKLRNECLRDLNKEE